MQVNSISKKHLEIRNRELFFLAFFVFSILIKIVASIQTPVNTFEGEHLLHLSGMSTGISTNISVIESVLVKEYISPFRI